MWDKPDALNLIANVLFGAAALLRRNLLVYGLGGLVADTPEGVVEGVRRLAEDRHPPRGRRPPARDP